MKNVLPSWSRPWVGIVLLGLLSAVFYHFYFREDRKPEPVKTLLVAGDHAGYTDAAVCATCHADIDETYRQTGMGRSFTRPRPENAIEDYSGKNTFYHRASDRHYKMYRRQDKYYQRRHQIGLDGSETNIVEKEIHFVLGSGSHARTYLHKTSQGELVELPVAWYREKGGYWAMNPGYDRHDHEDFRRRVTYDCMFCHNGYPEIEPGGDAFGGKSAFNGNMPEGIDCQRCHGPGRAHVGAAQAGAVLETIRSTIVNPARLDSDKQLELCMQCHLESTSTRLPYSVRRYPRGVFSYRPGQALADYALHFDHAQGAGHDDKFEIVNAAYRLRKSACFQKSGGRLNCVTCHDPHNIPRGQEALRHYVGICRSCHDAGMRKLIASKDHTSSPDCLACHMPKRRTDDVVHVVMTDHFIQRRKPGRDLLAPLAEKHDSDASAYKGEVILYYPSQLPPTADNELYLAVAQVKQKVNLKEGIPRLKRAIETHRPEAGEFYFELAKAHAEAGETATAIPLYEEALRRKPNFWPALHKLGLALAKSGQPERGAAAMRQAIELAPHEAVLPNDLALLYRQQGRVADAVTALRAALSLDPDLPQAYNNLGGALLEIGERIAAETAFRDAIRAQPDFAAAHNNLANALDARGDFPQAKYHFEKAIENDRQNAVARHDYGLALTRKQMLDQARIQLEAAVRVDPELAEAHNTLGDVLAIQGQTARAIQHYKRAIEIQPELAAARFNLGAALAAQGRRLEALPHLNKAAESSDPQIRQAAFDAIKAIAARK